MMTDANIHFVEVLLRVFAGILFISQGYDKLFRIKIPGVVAAFSSEASNFHIPKWTLQTLAYLTSITEFICGILLIVGLFTNYALYAIGIDLILVAIAFSMVEPMWDTRHLFPRFILVIGLLLLDASDNPFSLDSFINK